MDYQIFISHSSKNNAKAKELLEWLEKNGWQNVFLDLDPERGIQAGDKWQKKLRDACFSCEAILFLMTNDWLNSKWCLAEYLLAKQLGKLCIPLIVEDVEWGSLPVEMRAEHQIVDLRNESGLSQLQSGLLVAGIAANTFEFPADRSPFRGLETLTEEDAAVFFGRDAEIVRAIDQIRRMITSGTEKLMVILGPSGSGKSSLMRAGVWPRLNRNQFEFLPLPIVRPGASPLTGTFGLYAAIEGASNDLDLVNYLPSDFPKTRGAIKHYTEGKPENLIRLLEQLQSAAGKSLSRDRLPKLIFCLDQCEELYTLESDECNEFRKLFGQLLSEMESLLAVTTIRTNSYPLLQTDKFLDASLHAPFNLGPMKSWQYKDVIEGPAKVADVTVEPALVDAMLEDTKGADALPLLAFSLQRLNNDYGTDGDLTKPEYDQMGGISGSISIAVSECLSRIPFDSENDSEKGKQLLNLTKSTFVPQLVGIDSSGAFCRQIANKQDFPEESKPIVNEFVSSRLLIEDESNVEIAHEAIFRNWPAMKSWLAQEKEFLHWHDGLLRALDDHSSGERGLLTGKELDIAEKWASEKKEQLAPASLFFVRSSIVERDQDKERRRFWNRIITYGYVLASMGVLIFAFRASSAEKKALSAKASAQNAQFKAEQGEENLRELNRLLDTGHLLRVAMDKGQFTEVPEDWYPTANRSLRAAIRITTPTSGGSGFLADGKIFRDDWPENVIVSLTQVVNESLQDLSTTNNESYFRFFSDLGTTDKRKFGKMLWNSRSEWGVAIYAYDGTVPKHVAKLESSNIVDESFIESVDLPDQAKFALLHGNFQGEFLGCGVAKIFDTGRVGSYQSIRSYYASESGSAGAPVFDCESGKLIGLLAASVFEGPDGTFHVSETIWIHDFLNEIAR